MAYPRVGDRLGFDEVSGELAIHPMGPLVAVTEATLDDDDILAYTQAYIPLGTSLAQICGIPDTSTTGDGATTADPATLCTVEVHAINFVEVDFNDSGSGVKDVTIVEIFDRRFFAAGNTLADYQPGDIVAVIAANRKLFITGLVSACPSGQCPPDATTEEALTTPGDPTLPPTTTGTTEAPTTGTTVSPTTGTTADQTTGTTADQTTGTTASPTTGTTAAPTTGTTAEGTTGTTAEGTTGTTAEGTTGTTAEPTTTTGEGTTGTTAEGTTGTTAEGTTGEPTTTTGEPTTTTGEPTTTGTTGEPTTTAEGTTGTTAEGTTTDDATTTVGLACNGNIGFDCNDVPIGDISDITYLIGMDGDCCMIRVPFTECPSGSTSVAPDFASTTASS